MLAGVEAKLIPVSIVVLRKAIPLVTPAEIPPELVILKASVTTVEPVPLVSALSKSSRASVVESVNEPTAPLEMLIAY